LLKPFGKEIRSSPLQEKAITCLLEHICNQLAIAAIPPQWGKSALPSNCPDISHINRGEMKADANFGSTSNYPPGKTTRLFSPGCRKLEG